MRAITSPSATSEVRLRVGRWLAVVAHRHTGDVADWGGRATLAWLLDRSLELAAPQASRVESKLNRLQALVRATLGAERATLLLGPAARTVDLDVPPDVVREFRTVAESNTYARLAALYEALMDGPSRRRLGTFFTPQAEAAAVVDLYAVESPPPSNVVDVGAGVGVFTAAARSTWTTAAIWAVDLNPATLALQAAAMILTQGTDRVRLVEADYTRWLSSFQPDGPVLYLGNPPYTRWQLIPELDRPRLRAAAGGTVGPRANLSTLILAATLQHMRPQDGLAMILPASWMHASYGAPLRDRLLGATNRAIEVRIADSWRFDGAVVDAAVVVARPVATGGSSVSIAGWNGAHRRVLHREELGSDHRFAETPTVMDEGSATLADFATVRRGAATGANSFFLLGPDAARDAKLPSESLTPVIRRLRPGRDGIEATEALLFSTSSSRAALDGASAAYVAAGEVARIHERVLCQRRIRWWDLSAEVAFPNVVIGALGRSGFHIFPSDGETTITNNLFGLTWRATTTSAQRTSITAWLCSAAGQSALLRSAAPEASGLYRLSPRGVGRIPLPSAFSAERPHVIDASSLHVGATR